MEATQHFLVFKMGWIMVFDIMVSVLAHYLHSFVAWQWSLELRNSDFVLFRGAVMEHGVIWN